MYIAGKLFLTHKEWEDLPTEKREQILNACTKRVTNPNACEMRKRSAFCIKMKTGGRKVCFKCEAAQVSIRAYQQTSKFYKFYAGDEAFLEKVFGKKFLAKAEDRRVLQPMRHKLKFLYEKSNEPEKTKAQIEIRDKWLENTYGQIEAPARSGKTLLGSMILCEMQQKTAIFMYLETLATQFEATIRFFTNVEQLEAKTGKKLVVVNPTVAQAREAEICIYTYQQFLSENGLKRLKALKKEFGFIIVDESHRVPAKWFSSIVSSFWARYKLGLTATPERKDKTHFITDKIIGPVTVKGLGEGLPCTIYKTETGRSYDFHAWTTFVNQMSRDNVRNNFIAKCAAKDVKKGHRLILTVERIKHVGILVDKISALLPEKTVVGMTGETHKLQRKQIQEQASAAEIDVLVSIRRLVREGVNMPPMSGIYHVIPVADEHNYYQEICRVRTPLPEGAEYTKRMPIVRYFVDATGASESCFNNMEKKVHKKLGFTTKDSVFSITPKIVDDNRKKKKGFARAFK